MKQSRTTIKELTAAYHVVLRYGFLCNAIAIGLITVTPAMALDVSTASELTAALQAGSEITVTGNISDISGVTAVSGKTNVLDLNGKTISGVDTSGFAFSGGGSLTLVNGGTIDGFSRPTATPNTTSGSVGALQVDGTDVTISGGDWTFSNNKGGYAALNIVNGNLNVDVNKMVFSGNKTNAQGAGLRHDGGTTNVTVNAEKMQFINNTFDIDSNYTGYVAGSGTAVFNAGGTFSLLSAENEFTGNRMDINVDPDRKYKVGGGAVANQSHNNSGTPVNVTMIIGKDSDSVNTFTGNYSSTNGGAIMNRAIDEDGTAMLTINGESTFTGNESAINGGAIYNIGVGIEIEDPGSTSGWSLDRRNSVTLADATTFDGNKAGSRGGAIYNAGDMTINDATFTSNRTTTDYAGYYASQGGAIYNAGADNLTFVYMTSNGLLTINGATFGDKNDNTKGNSAIQGGAIANSVDETGFGYMGEITLNNTNFYYNKARADSDETDGYWTSAGGAIWNDDGNITVNGDTEFIGNTAEGYASMGGAIRNGYGDIVFNDEATFDSNSVNRIIAGNGAQGGAINNEGTITFKKAASFTGNEAFNTVGQTGGLTYSAKGGAIYNESYGTPATIAFEKGVTFEENTADLGGAIFNSDGTITLNDATFTGNIANSAGGAIFNMDVININAVDGDVVFSGNIANNQANDIYNTGTVNFDAASGKSISLEGIQGPGGTINKAGAGALNISEYVANQTVSVDEGELHLTTGEGNLYKSSVTVADGATINTIDDVINDYMTGEGNNGTITLASGAYIKGDIDFMNALADKYAADSAAVVKYKVGSLVGDMGKGFKTIQVVSDGAKVDISEAQFTSANGATFVSTDAFDGQMIVKGFDGGISTAADASATVEDIHYQLTENESLDTGKAIQNNFVLNGDGTEASDKGLELNGADLTAGEGSNVTINNLKLAGTGALNNAATAVMRINDSKVGVKLRNAGILYSDPTTYEDTLVNTGVANIDGDTFAATGKLENYNVANLKDAVFETGAEIVGTGVTNLVAGTTVFNNTANTNTVKIASGADFTGALVGGTLDTHNGAIDTISGAFSGGNLVLDAKLGSTKTIDTVTAGTIKEINILGTEYGTDEMVNLNIGSAVLDSNFQINGMNYYTDVHSDGAGNLVFTDKLVNTSSMYNKLGASWTGGTYIKSAANYTNAADSSHLTVGAALSALDTAVGDMTGFGSQHYATSTTSVAANLTALDTEVYGKADLDSANVFTGANTFQNANGVSIANAGGTVTGNMKIGTVDGHDALIVTGVDGVKAGGFVADGNAGFMTEHFSADDNKIKLTNSSGDTVFKVDNAGAMQVAGAVSAESLSTTGNATIGGTLTAGQTTISKVAADDSAVTALTVTAGNTEGSHTLVVSTAGVLVDGAAVLTTASELGAGNIAANAITTGKLADNAVVESKLSTDVQGKLAHAEDAYAAAVTNKTTAVASDNTNLITSAGVYANAKNASYNTAATNNIAANSSIGAAITALDTAMGALSGLDAGSNAMANRDTEGNITGNATNIVEALNNMSDTLGEVHGLAAKLTTAGTYKGNLAEGTTVEQHLAALDTAVGDMRGFATNNHAKNTDNVAANLVALDSAIGTTSTTTGSGGHLTATNSVSQNLTSLDSALTSAETSIATLNGSVNTTGSVLNTVRGNAENATFTSGGATSLGTTPTLTAALNSVGAAVDTNTADIATLNAGEDVTGSVRNIAKAYVEANVQSANAYTDERVDKLDKNLSAGVAGAVALSSVSVSDVRRGEMSVGAGYGYFNGQSAGAFGAAMGISNRWSVNAGAGISSYDVAFRAGTNYKFRLF